MSQAGGKKGAGKGPPKKAQDEEKAPSKEKAAEEKEETASNNAESKETKEVANGVEVAKPPSAGVTMREAAGKVLVLAQKGEWSAIEQTLKALEKLVAAGGEDALTVPLAGILDPVIQKRYPV